MYTLSSLERLCIDPLECGKVRLNAFIISCNNICHLMINKGALAEYSQVEVLFGALPKTFRARAVMKLKLDPRDTWTIKYNTHRKHVFHK
jgi:hypothetical protein